MSKRRSSIQPGNLCLQCQRRSCGSEGGPVTLPVFKTGERHLRCRWCVRLAHASAICFCAASHLTSLPSLWLLPRLNVSCIPQKPSLQPLHPQEPSSHMRSWLSRGSRAENGLNRLVWYAKPTQVGSQPAPKVVPSVPRDSGNLPCWTDHEPFEVRQVRRSASWAT